jgi:hypothetical protein
MSMAGKRYYGADVPRSTGPHPDPMEQLTELELVRQDAATAWDKCEERRLNEERLAKALAAAVEVIRVAGLMSNVCYNAKQKAGVPENVRTWLANTQESFDKARDVYLAAVGCPADERGEA